MTLALFAGLLVILAAAVSLITEAVKKFLQGINVGFAADVLALLIAVLVGVGGTSLAYLFMGIPFTLPNVACIGLMVVAVWVGSMTGYDKVVQMIEQVKTLKFK